MSQHDRAAPYAPRTASPLVCCGFNVLRGSLGGLQTGTRESRTGAPRSVSGIHLAHRCPQQPAIAPTNRPRDGGVCPRWNNDISCEQVKSAAALPWSPGFSSQHKESQRPRSTLVNARPERASGVDAALREAVMLVFERHPETQLPQASSHFEDVVLVGEVAGVAADHVSVAVVGCGHFGAHAAGQLVRRHSSRHNYAREKRKKKGKHRSDVGARAKSSPSKAQKELKYLSRRRPRRGEAA